MIALPLCAVPAGAQVGSGHFRSGASSPVPLDSLVARALGVSPSVRAAEARARATKLAVPAAGARPDPMLMAGVQNIPASSPSLSRDEMTMAMVGVSQTIPYPGKLPLRSRMGRAESAAADARATAARLAVARDVRQAYFALAAAQLVLDAVARQQRLAGGAVPAVEARYAAGGAAQADILAARSELATLAQDGAMLAEEMRAAHGHLNALVDRPLDAPLEAAFPERVLRAALGDTTRGPLPFTSAALGARLAGSPLPPVDSIVALAVRRSPRVLEHEAMIAAQGAAAELARREHLPDIDVSVQYGQRVGHPDMVTAVVSVPLPVQRARKQRPLADAARSELEAHEAEHHAEITALRAEVSRVVSVLERSRAQLALFRRVVLPQARAAVATSTASYEAGRGEFVGLLTGLRAVYTAETQYVRTLQDFALALAELEELAGGEVIP